MDADVDCRCRLGRQDGKGLVGQLGIAAGMALGFGEWAGTTDGHELQDSAPLPLERRNGGQRISRGGVADAVLVDEIDPRSGVDRRVPLDRTVQPVDRRRPTTDGLPWLVRQTPWPPQYQSMDTGTWSACTCS